MRPRVCICCGERMSETGNAFSRNPNMCASCSSMADGMADEESSLEKDQELTRHTEMEIPSTLPNPEEVHLQE